MRQQQPDHHSCFECNIIVENHLGNCWLVWFEDISVKWLSDDRVLFSGIMPDHAALFGLLNRIRDLNTKIISISIVKQLNDGISQ